jgi:alpha-L-fucosidase
MRLKVRINTILTVTLLSLLSNGCGKNVNTPKKSHQELLSEFVDMRFGMFICYNIMSYGAKWGEENHNISGFNPTKLDCDQWAKAAKSANMTFGLLTTKHHEGFCLWDSKFTKYDVASTPYKKDIVRQYVDAFRKEGLKVGLYYSIWDSTNGIDKGQITPQKMDFIKGQIRELLTNYGKIDYFVMDGWFWRIGHREVPYTEIRQLICNLQPDCLITDHTHLQASYHVDIPYFEGPFGAFPSENNTMATALGHCCVRGNGWFWSNETPNGLMKGENAETIVAKLKTLEGRYCNLMLNCMPNRDGLLDTLYLNLLSKIGQKWSPDKARKPLPQQQKSLIYEVAAISANATSGISEYAIDACQKGTDHFNWETDGPNPQALTIDLGSVYSGMDMLCVVPKHRCLPAPETSLTEGNVTHCKIYGSSDGKEFSLISEETWEADGRQKQAEFSPKTMRFLKIEVLAQDGEKAAIAEVAIGSSTNRPLKK